MKEKMNPQNVSFKRQPLSKRERTIQITKRECSPPVAGTGTP